MSFAQFLIFGHRHGHAHGHEREGTTGQGQESENLIDNPQGIREHSVVMGLYRQFHEWILGSWWVWLFVLFCFFCYEQAVKNLKEDFEKLEGQLESLQKELHNQLVLQEDLRIQINSQSDPSWIELVLMKGLGLVPEGQVKVFFKSEVP